MSMCLCFDEKLTDTHDWAVFLVQSHANMIIFSAKCAKVIDHISVFTKTRTRNMPEWWINNLYENEYMIQGSLVDTCLVSNKG
jgi:hypothetical protein